MNACGQLVIGEDITDLPYARVMREFYDAFGAKGLFEVSGILEIPENEMPGDDEKLYAFSPEAQRFSSVSRLNSRFDKLDLESVEDDRKENVKAIRALMSEETGYTESFVRMAASTEAPFCLVLKLSESDIPASREGWVRRVFRGVLLQREEPSLFKGIFYELSLDVQGEALMIFPSASLRHYAFELDDVSAERALTLPIWGYSLEPQTAVNAGGGDDA